MTESLRIDDFGPLTVRAPGCVSELSDCIRQQRELGQAIYPVGGGTKLHLGLVPVRPGVVVSTLNLRQVIDYPARDMTITAQAGIRIAELQQALRAEGQFLPVDVADPDRATLGGAVATNAAGPRRLGQGTLRDYVIGLSFVSDDGQVIQAGGRVVKNVAGYDLMKLQTGALGTLGVLTQLTLKVRPRPEASVLLAFGVGSAAVGPTLDRLHSSASRPVAVELLNREAARQTGLKLPDTDPFVILCGYEEKSVTVEWQVAELKRELATAPVRDLVELRDSAAWDALTHLQRGQEGQVILKANLPPSALAAFVAAVPGGAAVHAHAGNGIAFVHLPEGLTVEQVATATAQLAKLCMAGNSNLIVIRCPSAWKTTLPIWGRDFGDRVVMRTIKRTLDPQDLFNPGRLWG